MARWTAADVQRLACVSANAKHEAWKAREARALPVPLETDIQAAILTLCQAHPRVAWVERMNTGAAEFGEGDHTRFVRFAFKGCADILGQMRDGRFLAIEVKRPGKNPTEEQRAFLARVNMNRGLAFVARSVDDAARYLKDA